MLASVLLLKSQDLKNHDEKTTGYENRTHNNHFEQHSVWWSFQCKERKENIWRQKRPQWRLLKRFPGNMMRIIESLTRCGIRGGSWMSEADGPPAKKN